MPRVNWGVESSDIDGFDRDSQYAPYIGPVPADAVYQWKIKVAKYISGTREKLPQLRLGLELAPRAEYDEKRFKGYFLMAFIPISDKTMFRYVPFLDAIGVTSRDFTGKTITDEEGNIRRIGAWKNDGSTLILAEKRTGQDNNGNPRAEVAWIGPADESSVDDEEDEDYDVDTEEDEEYEEEAPPPRSRARATKSNVRRSSQGAARKRRANADDDWD